MRSFFLMCAIGLATAGIAQPLQLKGGRAGLISAGGRSSYSLFSAGHDGQVLNGIGGQFRIRLADRVNTDWFYDYFRGPIGNNANRMDQHVGWSVLYYLLDPGERRQLIQPYVLAGHCFDYSRQQANNDANNYAERWSSAVQAGLGTHINLTDRMDVSIVGQYMIHLGNKINAQENDGGIQFHEERTPGSEGHLLAHVSFNYILFDAW